MLAVISPAKNLDYQSPLPPLHATEPRQLDDSQQLIKGLKKLTPAKIAGLMHLSDALANLNFDRFQQWHLPFTDDNARPAVLAFNGDVYQGLQASQFSAKDFAFAQQHLRILSGLYGLLRPLDLIQPYRLEMGTSYASRRGKDLYAFWGERITRLLRHDLEASGSDVLINLASAEYFKSVKPKVLKARVIEPVFKDFHEPSGRYKVVSFFAKKARGLMSAYIVKNQLNAPEALQRFREGGYSFNHAMSKGDQWVFTRKA